MRPPQGYRPALFSGQPASTLYRWDQNGLTRLDTPTSADTTTASPRTPSEDYRYPVVRAARQDYHVRPPPRTLAPRETGRAAKSREPLQMLSDRAIQEMEERQARGEYPSRSDLRPSVGYQTPRVEEMDDPPLADAEGLTQTQEEENHGRGHLSELEFQQLLPRLQPHLDRMMGSRTSDTTTREPATKEKKPRHVLETIRATEEYKLPPFELGQHLKETPITLSVLQLLQIAPSVRQQLSRLMQCRRRMKGARAKEMVSNFIQSFREFVNREMAQELDDISSRQPSEEELCLQLGSSNKVGRPVVYRDTAAAEESVATTLGFIEGFVEGNRCLAIMLDGGSAVDLVNERYVVENEIPRLEMPTPGMIRLANDQIQRVASCLYLRVVVGGILATVKAYVMGNHDDWDVLLGRPWLRRMQATEDHYGDMLVVKGNKGHSQSLPILPSPYLFEPEKRPHLVHPKPFQREEEEEEPVFVESDQPILEEVEEILNELGREIYTRTDEVH